jgi:thiol:disulfide interchange protein
MKREVAGLTVVQRVLVGLGVAALLAVGLGACDRSSASAGRHGAGGVAWERDLGAALSRASGEKKLVMVDFYTDWCTWCRRLDQTTYADADVQTALRRLVPVKLNAETDGRLAAQRYRVRSFPTIVFLDGAGTEVGRIPGYLPPRAFLAELQDIMAHG